MKRLLALLVCLSVMLTCVGGLSFNVFASTVIEAAEITGEGSNDNPYIIDTAAKFKAVFSTDNTDTANTFDSVYYLTADIDLSALSYIPNTATFTGSLIGWDAKNQVKAKREINIGEISHAGSPYVVASGKNTEGHVGGLINKVNGAQNDISEISYLVVRGTVTGTSQAASNSGTGGVIGAIVEYVNVNHIDNYVNVNGNISVGGVIGTITKTTATIQYVNNYGYVKSLSGAYGCGGIAGLNYSAISYSNNYGVVEADANYGGGIVGMGYEDIEYCSNQGPVSSKRLTGGIISYAAKSISNSSQTLVVKNTWNSGKITSLASYAAGGIVGGIYLSAQQLSHVRPVYIYDCYNRGAVENTSKPALVASAIGDTFAAGYKVTYKKNSSTAEVAVDGSGRFCKVVGYYDVANTDMPIVKTSFAASSTYLNPTLVNKTTVTDAYVVSDSASTDATYGTNYVTDAGLKALKTSGYFADSEAWVEQDGYPYPSTALNPAVTDIFLRNDISGAGSNDNPYIIDTKEKFLAVFSKANTETDITHKSGYVYHLTTDIDLSTSSYLPAVEVFTGTLMGADENGNSVKREINLGTVDSSEMVENYTMGTGTYGAGGGLFHILDNANVSYLVLRGNVTNKPQYASGSLAGIANAGTAVSYVDSYVNLTGTKTAGGIIGVTYINSTIDHCVNYGTVKGAGVGGVVGSNFGSGNAYVTYSGNEGTVISSGHAGGITGQMYADVKYCYNTGNVSSTSEKATVGVAGIAAYLCRAGIKIEECWNSGKIDATKGGAAGGIAGLNYANATSRKVIINNCFNLGEISSASGTLGAAIGDSYTAANEVHGFYELKNINVPLYDTTQTAATHVIESAYIVGTIASTLNGLQYVDINAIKGLKNSTDAYFSTSKWVVKDGYSYPQLASIPYIGEDYVVEETVFIKNSILGSGTQADPYIIDTKDKFLAIFSASNTADTAITHADGVCYLQTEDLNIGEYSPCTATFMGEYHGGTIASGVITYSDKVIKVTINKPGVQGVAVFPKYTAVKISHLIIEGSVTGGKYTAGLLGEEITTGGSVISHITNKATINGASHSGGILGMARTGSIIENCTNTAKVKVTANYVGGIVGWANIANKYVNCVNTGEIIATTTYAGGIAGACYDSKIEKSYNTGNVSGTGQAGGIIGGYTMNSDKYKDAKYHGVSECWNSGTIDGGASATGGIIGSLGQSKDIGAPFSVVNCYNVGNVMSTHATAKSGAIGNISINAGTTVHDYSVTINGFYDIGTEFDVTPAMSSIFDKTKLSVSSAYVLSDEDFTYAEAVTKDELKALTTTDDAFKTSTWTMVSGNNPYPELANVPYVGDAVESNYAPENIEVYYEDGAYFVKWTAVAPADSYKLIIDGVVTENVVSPADVTEAIRNKTPLLQVVAVAGGKEHKGDIISANGLFAGGSGISGDPYLVADKHHLANVATKRNGYYKQMADITDVTEPIMLNTTATTFTGNYDGNHKSIDMNLVSPEDWPDVGANNGGGFALFPLIATNAVIKDLTLTGTVTSDICNTAALVGSTYANTFTVSGIKNYATIVSTRNETAAIIGRAYRNGTIENCFNYADITGAKAAGIVGCTNNGTVINNCGNYGNITATANQAAGIATYCYGGATNCFNVGTITSSMAAAGIMGGMQPGKPTDSGYKDVKVVNCYNVGTLNAPTTYGISYKTSSSQPYIVKDCYNAVYAKYPISDMTAEIIEEFNTTYNKEFVIANNYYLTKDTNDNGTEGNIPVTSREELKTIALDNSVYEVSGNFEYPQLKSNKLEADRDDISLVLVTFDKSAIANTDASIKNFAASSFYVQSGAELTVSILPSEFYSVEAYKNEGSMGIFAEEDEVLISVEADTVVSFTEEAINAVLPDSVVSGEEIFAASNEAITVDKVEYTRYAILAAKVAKASGLKVKEFGMLLNLEDGDFTIETAKAKAKADDEKINDNGAYGILIHGEDIKSNYTYYVRPYVIYEDKDGAEHPVYGTVRSFVISDAE